FWLNTGDEDACRYMRLFTLLSQEEIEDLEARHREAPHQRILQKRLAAEVTTFVHSAEDCKSAEIASGILFGKSTKDDLLSLSESDFLSVFEGVPQAEVSREELKSGIGIIELLGTKTGFLKSNSEAIRSLREHAISVNKVKVTAEKTVDTADLINDKYILLQRGKKSYFLLKLS
ncbi:MAG: tyrosine--tRNA ligase, partial [Flavobacteriales bacterium]